MDHVSITKSGRINLDQSFIERYEIHKEAVVELYPDDDAIHMDVVHASDAVEAESFPVITSSHGRSAYIDAASFFQSIEGFDLESYADTSLPIRFVLSDREADEFTIDLNK